jgi:GntR family transcriptional regulator
MTDNTVASGRRQRKESLARKLAADLRQGIANGDYRPGSRLPPEPEFAERVGVSRVTLREALRQLEGEGLITRRQRRGTFVSARPVVYSSLDRNFSVRHIIEASGKEAGTVDARISFTEAPPDVSEALELEARAPVTVLERIRTADGRPVVLTTDFLDSRIVEHATAPLLPDVTFYEWLRDHCGIVVTHGLAHVSAVTAETELARRLGIAEGAPMLRLHQVDFTAEGRPVLHSREFHVSDAFDITVVRSGPYA